MLTNKVLISIIIPCYNHADYLAQSIESIINNCSYSYEIIVVNDGSTDNTLEILSNYSANERILVLNQENSGIANALNAGFNLAKGSFVTWTSADNAYKNSALDKLTSFLIDNPDIDLVYSDVELIDQNSKTLKNSQYRLENQDKKNTSILRLPRDVNTLSLYSDNFINACFLYRRWAVDLLDGYKKELLGFEDYEYWLKILAAGKISHINTEEVLYRYRLHSNSLTSNLDAQDLSQKQKLIVKKYNDIINLYTANNCEQKLRIEQDSFLKKEYKTKSIKEFISSLPLVHKLGVHPKIELKIASKFYNTNATIETPEILSRIKNSDYKSVEHDNKIKLAIFLPNFLSDNDLEKIADIIKRNSKSTFVAVALDLIQKEKANKVNLLLKGKNYNYRIIDISGYKEKDTLLEQEKYLPFIYALANSNALLVPSTNDLFFYYNILAISSISNVPAIMLGQTDVDSYYFRTKNYKDFNTKNIESDSALDSTLLSNWHNKVSHNESIFKILKIKHFFNTQKSL